jgi:ubiquinone/menaquinone biosynthesis C-methylase UbiE
MSLGSVSKNGVLYFSEPSENQFEEEYIKLRTLENRILTDEQVKQLPYLQNHPKSKEWEVRQQSTQKFLEYINGKAFNTVLEIGCGNGWFSNLMAKQNPEFTVWGVDVNVKELDQAARIFKNTKNLRFAYWDIFENHESAPKPGLIVLNASVQYFENINTLLKRLFKIIKAYGEIHIIDSPFYGEEDALKAKQRTIEYYSVSKAGNLIPFYHHHVFDNIDGNYSVKKLYNPKGFSIRLKKLTGKKQNPFPWLKITK